MKKMFCIGAIGYGLLELLWRGRTHWTMLLTGGACLCGIWKIVSKNRRHPIRSICLKCAAMITAVEYLVGIIVNKLFKMKVWDYSSEPGNVQGQICPLYSFLWFLLSYPLVKVLKKKAKKSMA